MSFDVRQDAKSSDEERFEKIEETQIEQWDCESILSKLIGSEDSAIDYELIRIPFRKAEGSS